MKPTKQLMHTFSSAKDDTFISLIEEFTLENKSINKVYIEHFINFFFRECQKEKDLFANESTTLQLNKLKMNHILKIQERIQFLLKKDTLEKTKAVQLLNLLSKFCKFLTNKEIAIIYYKSPINHENNLIINKNVLPIIFKFTNFMEIKNYASSTIHHYVTSVNYFLEHSNYKLEMQNHNDFWETSINQFEKYLSKEVLKEKIALCTAYGYLKAVRLFFRFLNEDNHIRFRYKIPERMIQNGKRSNEYVSTQDVLLVIEKIFEHSKDVLRDISIFLIILETGCRPIEVVNLSIDDIYFNEKLIVLKSKKSYQRTLCLTDTTISFIKHYLQIRKNYSPKNNTKSLFLSSSGTQIRSNFITQLFRNYNLKTFKEIRFTPKTLRHTFITNALNNNNSIAKVKDTVGHKHLVSTHYYFYRDINNMKKLFNGKKLF